MNDTLLENLDRLQGVIQSCATFQAETTALSPNLVHHGVVGAFVGAMINPIAALVGATAGTLIGSSTSDHCLQIPLSEISDDRLPQLQLSLQELIRDYALRAPYQDRLTWFTSLFNGCALYNVPKDVCAELIPYTGKNTAHILLNTLLNFVYSQLEKPSSSMKDVETLFGEPTQEDFPHVLELYLFADAMLRYFSCDEADANSLKEAKACLNRVPQEYQDFMLLKSQIPSASGTSSRFYLPQLTLQEEHLSPDLCSKDRSGFQERQAFLHLQIPVNYRESSHMSLSAKLQALMQSEQFVYQAADSVYAIQSILRDFAHTHGNMNTTKLPEISRVLFSSGRKYNDPELQKAARFLLMESKIKKDLCSEIQLMRLRCREDVTEISKLLYNSICTEAEAEAEGITDLLDNALQMCLYRILYDKTDRKAELARRQLRSFAREWPVLCASFEQEVLVGGCSCQDWLKTLAQPIQFEAFYSKGWSALRLYRSSFSSVLLEDMIGELLFNAFKYGDLSSPIQISFWEDISFCGLALSNKLPENPSGHMEGCGLESRNETLSLLNGKNVKSVEYGEKDGTYFTLIRLQRNQFLN